MIIIIIPLSLGLELVTSNFSGCTQEEVFKAFGDYLVKLVGYSKFAKSQVSSFANFGSSDDYEQIEKNTKKDKKRLFEELATTNSNTFTRNEDALDTGRAKNAIHRTIAKLFLDALEREVSDTVSKVDKLSANINEDNDKLIIDVYKYPFIDKERSIHQKEFNWNEYWNSCFSEIFYFCKGKRNLIF